MAKMTFKTGVVTVNGVDISNHTSEVTIETSRDEKDVTSLQSANKEILSGIGDATMTFKVFQDFAAGSLDAILWPLSTSDTPFVVTVKPVNAATSATNPQYSMTALLFNYQPIAGGVGDPLETTITFRNASATGLTRATS